MVQVTLSQLYNKVNIAVDYSAVEVYLHTFSATALDGGVQLTSTSEGLSRQNGPPVRSEFEAWRDNHKGRNGQKIVVLHNYVNRTTSVQTLS